MFALQYCIDPTSTVHCIEIWRPTCRLTKRRSTTATPQRSGVCATKLYRSSLAASFFGSRFFRPASWWIDMPWRQTPSPSGVYATELHRSSYVAPSSFTWRSVPYCRLAKRRTTTAKPISFWCVRYQFRLSEGKRSLWSIVPSFISSYFYFPNSISVARSFRTRNQANSSAIS